MADWILEDAGPAPGGLVLIGHSMGALVALAAAARAPDRVHGLVLLGAGESMPVNPDLLASARAAEDGTVDMIVKWAFARPAEGEDPARRAAMTDELRQIMLRANDGTLGSDLAACDAFRDAADRAAKIYCPALVLTGTADKMCPPEAGAALAAHLPDGRHMPIDGCGHMMMLERPMETAVATLSLLAGLPDLSAL
jgi:pimeloyl-ACP methyl ester carboxylesterase